MIRIAFLALWLLPFDSGLLPLALGKQGKAPQVPPDVELVRDVEYGKGGGRALKLHILRPKTPPKDPMPVVVFVHGGGWRGGNRDAGIGGLSRLAQRGYFGATIEYRLSGEATYPAQIEDAKCAIRFLIMHGDKDNLVPLGQSELLHEALRKAGVASTLHVVQGAGHGFGGPEVQKMVDEFFDKHLKR